MVLWETALRRSRLGGEHPLLKPAPSSKYGERSVRPGSIGSPEDACFHGRLLRAYSLTVARPIRLAVLISGGGRTMENLHAHIQSGKLNATMETVVSSRRNAGGVERARRLGLRTVVVERREHESQRFDERITSAIGDADLVCMAGFLSLWRFPDHLFGRVMNIHPALLPSFGGLGMYGRRVHEAVIESGTGVSGCTVHFCDNEYDHGPIILQRRTPVLAEDTPDTLADRVFREECAAYPQAIRWFGQGRIELCERSVLIRPTGAPDP